MRPLYPLLFLVAIVTAVTAELFLLHRRHPRAAHDGIRGWATARGWRWSRPAYLSAHLALGLVLTIAMLLVLAQISDWVVDSAAITRFDVLFDTRLHSMASPGGIRVAKTLSLIGGPPAMMLLGVAGALYLFFIGRDRELFLAWIAAIAGGGVLDWVLKSAFHRPRPLFADPIAHGYGFSFPSGHSMGSLIGFGMLAYVLTRRMPHGATWWGIMLTATALTLAVGVSRLYLGVHFPSDVLAGFAAGLMWLAACVSGVEIARGRHPSSMLSPPPVHTAA